MKSIAFYRYLLGGLLMAITAACSGSDDDNIVPTPTDDTPKTVRLTITQIDDEGSAGVRLLDGTRATLNESGKTLLASWEKDDTLSYCNLKSYPYSYGNLTANTTARTSSFTGDVTCEEKDNLAVVYPATTFIVGNGKLQPYTISLDGQDGTLETLATKFHHVYGLATVNEVRGTEANATMTTKSLLTVCKFSFIDKDKDNNNDITVKELKISFDLGVTYTESYPKIDPETGHETYPLVSCRATSYPHSATVRLLDNDNNAIAQNNVHATPVAPDADNTPLIVTLKSVSKDVYVALLPTPTGATEKIHFKFEVTDEYDQTYSGTARAYLHEGKYVVATGLKLTKTN